MMKATLMGTEKLKADFQKHGRETDKKASDWAAKWLKILVARSRKKLTYNRRDGKSGGRDTGAYAQSIAHQMKRGPGGVLGGRYGSGKSYGPFVEFKIQPHLRLTADESTDEMKRDFIKIFGPK